MRLSGWVREVDARVGEDDMKTKEDEVTDERRVVVAGRFSIALDLETRACVRMGIAGGAAEGTRPAVDVYLAFLIE